MCRPPGTQPPGSLELAGRCGGLNFDVGRVCVPAGPFLTRAALRNEGYSVPSPGLHLWSILQVGDQLDRGGGEIAILFLLERLRREAAAAGGALHTLNGNHETMNVSGRHRYATPGGHADFQARYGLPWLPLL